MTITETVILGEDDLPPMDDPSAEEADELQCGLCQRNDFKNLRGLRRHLSVTHGEVLEPMTPTGTAPRTSPVKRGGKKSLEKEIQDTLTFIGMSLSIINQRDGMIVVSGAHDFAIAWNELAQRNPKVHAAISSLTQSTSYAQVIMATMAIAVPIMGNHGMLPAAIAAMFGGAPTQQHEPPPRPYVVEEPTAEVPGWVGADDGSRAGVG